MSSAAVHADGRVSTGIAVGVGVGMTEAVGDGGAEGDGGGATIWDGRGEVIVAGLAAGAQATASRPTTNVVATLEIDERIP